MLKSNKRNDYLIEKALVSGKFSQNTERFQHEQQ